MCVSLQAYSGNLVDYHLILDLLPSLARLYLSGQLPATLSYSQVRLRGGLGFGNCTMLNFHSVGVVDASTSAPPGSHSIAVLRGWHILAR
jgi:N-acetyltransferase 10